MLRFTVELTGVEGWSSIQIRNVEGFPLSPAQQIRHWAVVRISTLLNNLCHQDGSEWLLSLLLPSSQIWSEAHRKVGERVRRTGCTLLHCGWVWRYEVMVWEEKTGTTLSSTPGNQWLEIAFKTTRIDAITWQMERPRRVGTKRCVGAASYILTRGRAWANLFPHPHN